MNLEKRFTEIAIEKLAFEIAEAGGNEVFFRGIPEENGCIDTVEVIARGNEGSVPAIINRLKKREVMIHNHPSGYLFPSDNDVKIASLYGQSGGGSYIINNDVTDLYVIVEPARKMEKIDITPFFCEDGIISKIFEGYEYRHEQLDMAKTVEKSLNHGKTSIIEAGTGTGKTLAYLIPALEWGILNSKRIVVSTNTINLQEQLMGKDIPLVKSIINKDFKKVLVKGRGNYLCIRKAKNINLADYDGLSETQKNELKKVTDWGARTSWGDKNELDFEPSYSVWEKVNSEADLCLKNKCYYKDKCYFLKARREAATADLLVTNHHIYFADLALRKEAGFLTEYAILPSYEAVIFDEAHNIEKVARDYFSHEVSKYDIAKLLNNIYNYKGEKSASTGGGAVLKALSYLKERNYDKALLKKMEDFLNAEIIERHKSLFEKTSDFFVKLIDIYSKTVQQSEVKVRLHPEELAENMLWKNEVLSRKNDVLATYHLYYKKMAELEGIIEETEDGDEVGLISDFSKYLSRVKSFYETLTFIFDMDSDAHVYWLEINIRYNNITVHATPLKIKEHLQEALYQNIENIVFTSATLSVGKSFGYLKEALGIEHEVVEKVIKSPFNYKNQMKILIPKDLKDPSSKDFIDDSLDFLKKTIRLTNGRTFILFTAYSTLNYTYYKIRDELEKEGFTLLVQGEHPRHRLLDIFKNSNKAVLFGADSFWEGVDVRGEKLSSVIIVKLPFKVPSEPVVEAIIENIEKEGGNPFMEYQIPEAVIKFKQGIGRLIRSKTDKGFITILDVRIISKAYGKLFKEALPDGKIYIDTRDKILDIEAEF